MAKFEQLPSSKVHFFAGNVESFYVNDSYEAVIRFMKKKGLTFTVWMIPAPLIVDFLINDYNEPQHDGAIKLADYCNYEPS